MKKLNKILSAVLAASMVISCCAMNVFAASTARTITITPSKTEGITAGETIVVEVSMDNTLNLVSCEYKLTYDATAFTADTTKVSRVEKCIDKTWLDGIKDTDGDWGYYLGNPTYNVANAGVMDFQWAGSTGVEADYAMDNRVIGKFNLTVKDDVADGTYTFALTGLTGDAGENSTAAMVCTPVTVTVGEAGPTLEEATATVTSDVKGTTKGFLATCVVDKEKNYPISAIQLNFYDDVAGYKAENDSRFKWNTTVEDGTVKFAANITGVEKPDNLTAKAVVTSVTE